MAECIIVMRNNKYTIIGPFESADQAEMWADEHWDMAGSDPGWQALDLADPHAAPVVLSPSDPAAIAAIQE